jgi:hypothetical protein
MHLLMRHRGLSLIQNVGSKLRNLESECPVGPAQRSGGCVVRKGVIVVTDDRSVGSKIQYQDLVNEYS